MSTAATNPAPVRDSQPSLRGAVLALGFGLTVSMWGVGYVGRLPGLELPGPLLFAVFVGLVFGAGFLAGRLTGKGFGFGLKVGALAWLLNLLVLGSLLSEQGALVQAVSTVSVIALGAGLSGLGALAGRASLGSRVPAERAWTPVVGLVAGGATALMLVVGGLVTSHDAGLAVPDWPRTYGWSMFLFPLSRMTGGIYYEHTHRLLGSLVGLSTIAFCVQVFRDPRSAVWQRRLGLGLVLLVCVQGVLGGLRVTGNPTLATHGEALAPSSELAAVHGVLGQLFFSLLLVAAATTTRTWRELAASAGDASPRWSGLHAWAVGTLVAQLVLGALVRHLELNAAWHVFGALVVLLVVTAAAAQAWSRHDLPVLPRLGHAVVVVIGLQLLLGIAALAGTQGLPQAQETWGPVLATAHQSVGALLLALAAQQLAWTLRAEARETDSLVPDEPREEPELAYYDDAGTEPQSTPVVASVA